jgi:hypothetical protein
MVIIYVDMPSGAAVGKSSSYNLSIFSPGLIPKVLRLLGWFQEAPDADADAESPDGHLRTCLFQQPVDAAPHPMCLAPMHSLMSAFLRCLSPHPACNMWGPHACCFLRLRPCSRAAGTSLMATREDSSPCVGGLWPDIDKIDNLLCMRMMLWFMGKGQPCQLKILINDLGAKVIGIH